MAAIPTRKANTGANELTATDIEDGYAEESYGGWGYLNERANHGGTDQHNKLVLGDSLLLEHANNRGWDTTELFMFTNSRIGRHYGDLVFGGYSDQEITDQANSYFMQFERATISGPLL